MLGNVYEYTADKYDPNAFRNRTGITVNPIVTEGEEWVIRGGYFGSDAARVRSAARSHTRHDDWLRTDPQQPRSIWWYADFRGIGFRVVLEPDSVLPNDH
jgi:formylglycine-generating enzyme required for sulfatase activity